MRTILMLLALATLAWPAATRAETRSDQRPFMASVAVDDAALDAARGGQSPFAPLTVRTTRRLLDAQQFSDLRQTGTIARVTMDIWWAETGSEMIAANVRATLP